jgi:ketosteroid isomerase-like protein
LRLVVKQEQQAIDQENIMLDNKARELGASSARKPEDCDRILLAALEAGDIETSVALYEPTAVLFKKSGETMTGYESIRANNAALIALKPVFHIEEIITTLNGDGTIATTRMKARLEGTQADGKPVNSAIHTLEVLRKQADGSWRYVIDDPFGSMRASMGERSSP